MKELNQMQVGIIGLGYVGLPLAVEFAKVRPIIGFDINTKRIDELNSGFDRTDEVEPEVLKESNQLIFSSNINEINHCDIYIITVPTPIDSNQSPDFGPLLSASKAVSQILTAGNIVIYESTVYPGATEELCVPLLEEGSGLKFNQDFYCGYSPERINPGDKKRPLSKIMKITSGSTPKIAELVDQLYAEIIEAGTHRAQSIKVAEAAKVIENTQRDLNVALINELAIIFNKLNIDTQAVLNAAGTKWNFIPFTPGLVGGHCISVDPYYLTHKAQSIGYNPEIILAGRRLNDNMGAYIAGELIKGLVKENVAIDQSKILILGFTFKENCPDIRNTRVIDVVNHLREYHCNVDIYDPYADKNEVLEHYQLELMNHPNPGEYDGIIIAVSHRAFIEMGIETIKAFGKAKHVLYDIKHVFEPHESDMRL